MPAKVILNPYANRWNALKRREEAEAALRAAGIEYELVVTETPGHGTRLAQQAVNDGFCPVISAGGDGSISEVMNGILLAAGAGQPVPLGILPLGSANDLVDNLGLPKDLVAAARVIAQNKIRQMDVCQVKWQDGGVEKTRFFDNNGAIGLEPYITLIQQRIHRLHGTSRYLVATLRGVLDNPSWKMSLAWDSGDYQGPVSLVTVGNCARTGGVFYMTPNAGPFDGLLTFVYGYIPTRGQVLKVLPMTMKAGAGNYVEHPAIHQVNATWLRIHVETPTPMHADGEIQSTSVQDLEYSLLPGRLPILLPE